MVKDHRTGIESSNPNDVLDGNLDEFIHAYLNGIKTIDRCVVMNLQKNYLIKDKSKIF